MGPKPIMGSLTSYSLVSGVSLTNAQNDILLCHSVEVYGSQPIHTTPDDTLIDIPCIFSVSPTIPDYSLNPCLVGSEDQLTVYMKLNRRG